MSQFECYGWKTTVIVREDTFEARDRTAAALAFKARHGFWPENVGEDVVLGICEACDKPIFEGDDYNHDEEGIRWHKECELP